MPESDHQLRVSLPIHFLTTAPREPRDGAPPVVLGLHGYAGDAASMLDLLTRFVPGRFLIVSIQGPHTTLVPGQESERKVGWHWGVSPVAEENRAAHREAIARVLRWVRTEGGDLDRVFLAGFSQPCSFNYRVALAPPHERPFRGLLAFCGGVPGEWTPGQEGTEASRSTPVLHVSTRDDPYYAPAKVAGFQSILERRFASVSLRPHEGGHRLPSSAFEDARRFLEKHA